VAGREPEAARRIFATGNLRFDVAVTGLGQYGGVIAFRLVGIPVRIQGSFLVIAVLLGISTGRPVFVVAWVGIVFVSILIHELGHALTARSFGAEVEIELNGIGGLTSWSGAEETFGPGRRALVAAAGSAVGVVFGGLIWLTTRFTGPYFGVAEFVVSNLIFVNVFWGLLNWLPIRPLDGGHLFLSLLQKVAPARAERIANVVFLVTAVAALAAGLWFQRIFVAILAGWLVMSELSRGRPRRPAMPIPTMSFDSPSPDEPPIRSDEGDAEPEPEPEPEPKQADG
jgi:stage IV sporulation protein FB